MSQTLKEIIMPKKKSLTPKVYNEFLDASSLVYSALQNPKCKEVKEAFGDFLDNEKGCVDIKKLDNSLKNNQLFANKSGKQLKGGGKLSLKQCVALVMSVLIVAIAIYFGTLTAENAHYRMHCADYEEFITPKSSTSFMSSLYKVGKMTLLPKSVIDDCKKLQQQRNDRIYNIITFFHGFSKDFTTIVKTIGSVIFVLVMLFSQGTKALLCIAAKYLDLDQLCDVDCTSVVVKRKIKPTSESSPEDE